jgi:histidinol phosphatase-like PHP family hydrolase
VTTRARSSRSATFTPPTDLNIVAAGLLDDLATVQPSKQSSFGYARAAKALASGTDLSIAELAAEGRVRDVPFVGASSERVVMELVRTGRSAIVDTAVAASTRRAEVEKRRRHRRAFLSRHAMRVVLDAALPRSIVSTASYRGDLQMHSTWSDGSESIASMAEAALVLGWTRIGITDHSYGLPIAHGMSMADAQAQHLEIDRVNEQCAGRVRVYKGVEANILADGSLDLGREERALFEYVIASPHSLLRRDADQTARMVAAVRQPGVAILGHPQGRMYSARPGVSADWDRVFKEAAARSVAVEIDGNWHRQDIDYELAARALDAGCLFALDSDAHSIPELPFTDYAIAHARLARVPADRVVNCWNAGKFEAWLAAKRQGTR